MKKLSLIIAFFFLFFFAKKDVYAQQCAPTRVINQYACVTGAASCFSFRKICSFSGNTCTNVGEPCGSTEGNCIEVCDGYRPTNTCNVVSDTVACTAAPSCNWSGYIKQCSSSASAGTCTETNTALT